MRLSHLQTPCLSEVGFCSFTVTIELGFLLETCIGLLTTGEPLSATGERNQTESCIDIRLVPDRPSASQASLLWLYVRFSGRRLAVAGRLTDLRLWRT
jgi:hypothetical protein